MSGQDWTVGPSGRSNTSEQFEQLVGHTKSLILQSGHDLVRGNAETVARLIVAQLAHVYHFGPLPAEDPMVVLDLGDPRTRGGAR